MTAIRLAVSPRTERSSRRAQRPIGRSMRTRRSLAALVLALACSFGAASTGDREPLELVASMDRAYDAEAWDRVLAFYTADAVAAFSDAMQAGAPAELVPMRVVVERERELRRRLGRVRSERSPLRLEASAAGTVAVRTVAETMTGRDGLTLTAISEETYSFRRTPAGLRIARLGARLVRVERAGQQPAAMP